MASDRPSCLADGLDSSTYFQLKSDPTAKTERLTREKIKRSSIPMEDKWRLFPSAAKPPHLYGLPKVHKEGVPLRPIVSNIDAPTYKLAQYIARSLQPFAGRTDSSVKNSTEFIHTIKNIEVKEQDVLVSFDVISLFTNTPINDSMQLIKELTSEGLPKDFPDLTEFCLKKSYFLWNDKCFQQKEGAAMGSPLSPVVVDIFMENLEKKAIKAYPKKPSLWICYVDHTFVIWPHGK
ncbi:uncharacterized protein [Hetaerina americana]|uniref:uncharacterized protein n=1 Tax=Hetaerina americana TaxID=62018 RepID=UPI003A7F2055